MSRTNTTPIMDIVEKAMKSGKVEKSFIKENKQYLRSWYDSTSSESIDFPQFVEAEIIREAAVMKRNKSLYYDKTQWGSSPTHTSTLQYQYPGVAFGYTHTL